jgi:hypothetical protein
MKIINLLDFIPKISASLLENKTNIVRKFVFTFSFIYLIITLALLIISPLEAAKLKLKDGPIDQPITLNVTYESPMRDLNEERKYTIEHLNYARKVRRLAQKFSEDMDLLKMIINVQNIQIDKLNEIIMVNNEIAKEYLSTGRKFN